MNKDAQNFAADLRRIAYWIHEGQDALALKMLSKARLLYNNLPSQINNKVNLDAELKKIINYKDKNKAAETALTLSNLLIGFGE